MTSIALIAVTAAVTHALVNLPTLRKLRSLRAELGEIRDDVADYDKLEAKYEKHREMAMKRGHKIKALNCELDRERKRSKELRRKAADAINLAGAQADRMIEVLELEEMKETQSS